jgi:hypothetical protein
MESGIILAINHLLCRWGRWAARQKDGGNGYPRMSPMFNNMPKGNAYESHCPELDQDLLDTDEAVRKLERKDRALCIEIYQIGGSGREIARRLQMCHSTYIRKTMRVELPRIHRELMLHLDEMTAVK